MYAVAMNKKAQRKALAAAKKARRAGLNPSTVTPAVTRSPKKKAPVYIPRVERPFHDFTYEVEIAAMRELLPAATLTLHTTGDYGDRDVLLVTVAPEQAQGVRTTDGRLLVALQTQAHSMDASHDVALVLSRLLDADEPTVIDGLDVRQEAPALRDMIATESDFRIHTDFGFWLDPDEDITPEIRQALDASADSIVQTRQVPGVRGAFVAQMNHPFLRWVRPEDETAVLNGLARLLADKKTELTDGSRAIGAFRMLGLLTPVWQFDDDTPSADIDAAVTEFDDVFSAAIADETPLTPQQRRARDGFISREVSLR